MRVTKEWLKEKEACTEGIEWFLSQTETDGIAVVRSLISAGKKEWANWTITRILDRKQKIKYAIFAAEQVLGIFEKKNPDDKRPRLAIDAARAVLVKNDAKTRAAAWAAGSAARAAGDAMKTKIIEYGISLLDKK